VEERINLPNTACLWPVGKLFVAAVLPLNPSGIIRPHEQECVI